MGGKDKREKKEGTEAGAGGVEGEAGRREGEREGIGVSALLGFS